ncbi:MAG: site-2 protease family protein, partial [Tepidimonas sp.]|nr:site-2 protease family protein [Tepidimonas sp.]
GDTTAAMLGRVTLNPLPHVDPIGTVLVPVLLYFATQGAFLFGYARPVPVNASRLRHPRRDMVWVALAGPASNFVQAIGWAVLFTLLVGFDVQERFFTEMAKAGILVNLVMWAFNLFPLPPLDGGHILAGLLGGRPAQVLARIEPYGFFIVLALVLAGIVGSHWLRPLIAFGYQSIDLLLSPLRMLL